jgi:hypothetical protein
MARTFYGSIFGNAALKHPIIRPATPPHMHWMDRVMVAGLVQARRELGRPALVD